MAELLYLVTRFSRPRTVLEAGMGYTTPFIAKALFDNREDWRLEREKFVKKTAHYVKDIEGISRQPAASITQEVGLSSVYAPKASELATRRTSWMFESPALLRPGYYNEIYSPSFFCVDNFSDGSNYADRVEGVLKKLGLDGITSIHNEDFWASGFKWLPSSVKYFDQIWLDLPVNVLNALSLVEGRHWDLLNPDGGLLLIHCMLTNEGGQEILREFEWIQKRSPKIRFEMLGLIEPHKVLQNNVLLIRKVTGLTHERVEQFFTAPSESRFEEEARQLILGI